VYTFDDLHADDRLGGFHFTRIGNGQPQEQLFEGVLLTEVLDSGLCANCRRSGINKTNAIRNVLFTASVLKYGFAPRFDLGTAAKGHR
jgi:hypothetical protein